MTLYEMNLQALIEQNPQLGASLFTLSSNENFDVYMDDKEPLNINIVHRSSSQIMYETVPLQETIESVDRLEGRYGRYPYLYFFGLGNGVFYKLLLQNEIHSRIVVIEPELEILYIVLNCLAFHEDIKSGRLVLVLGTQMSFPLAADLFNDPQSKIYSKLFQLEILNSFYESNYSQAILESNRIFIKTIEHSITAIGNDSMDALIGLEHHLMNIEKMVRTPTLYELFEKAKMTPTAVLVSTGPSLAKQLSLLKEIQDHVTIFCVDASFPILVREGIKPDVVLALERVAATGRFFAEVPVSKQEGVIFCITSIAHPNTLRNIKAGTLQMSMRPFGYTRYFDLSDYGYAGIGMSAANMAYEIIFHSKFETCILIGQDLAYGENGTTHSEGHVFGSYESKMKDSDINVIAYGGEGVVRTRQVWSLFKNFFESDIYYAKNNGMQTINATEGGARIEGANEVPFDEAIKNNVDQRIQKLGIVLTPPSEEDQSKNLALIQEKKEQMLIFTTRIQEEVNTLFLDVVHTAEYLNSIDAFNNHDKVDFQALSILMDRIDKVKNYFSDPMFADIFLDAAQAVIMHEEMELAMLEVWEPKSDQDRRNKMISWVKMHGSWLFSLAGIIDAALTAMGREGDQYRYICYVNIQKNGKMTGRRFMYENGSKSFEIKIFCDGEEVSHILDEEEGDRFAFDIPEKYIDGEKHTIKIVEPLSNYIVYERQDILLSSRGCHVVIGANGTIYGRRYGDLSGEFEIEIKCDGHSIAYINPINNNVGAFAIGGGYFNCKIPLEYFDDKQHCITIHTLEEDFVIGTYNVTLSNTDRTMQEYEGYVVGKRTNGYWGWAYRSGYPSEHVYIDVYRDDSFKETICADGFHEGFIEKNLTDGYSMFEYPVNDEANYRFCYQGTQIGLLNSLNADISVKVKQ